MHSYVLHNREIREASDCLLSPGQVGFLNGWGVFSTLRLTGGCLFAFERHYARMQRDAKLLRIPFDLTAEDLRARLLAFAGKNGTDDAVVRVAWVRNKGGLFETSLPDRECDLLAFSAPLTDWPESVNLTYVPDARFARSPFAGTKITSWAHNLAWYELAHSQGFDEALLLNESGQVSECTSANIFVVRGNAVWTPPIDTSGCLPGVTRAILLEELQLAGITIGERDLTPAELEKADCTFITSTTRDLLLVSAVDGHTLRRETSVVNRLREAFLAFRKVYMETASREPVLLSS